jgi:hypothetical protein
MVRFAWAGIVALLPACSLYFGDSDDPEPAPPPADAGPAPDPVGERLDREYLTGIISGRLVDVYWNYDELFLTWGSQGMMGETVSWGPTNVVSLFGTTFPVELEPVRVHGAWAITIADHYKLVLFGTGFPQTTFPHMVDDVARLDYDGDGTADYVTAGDGIVRRCAVPKGMYDGVATTDETTLLPAKAYQYIAVANLAGSSSPDIFYMTKGGQIGLATQTSPDVFTDQVLGNGTQPQRMHLADVDGDGLVDVVGASPAVFVYSTKINGLVQLGDTARAITVGDIDGDGVDEPVFLTADGLQVRRIDGLTTSSPPASKVVLNTTEAQALAVANMDGDVHEDVALIHEAGQPTSWFELRRATSFGF